MFFINIILGVKMVLITTISASNCSFNQYTKHWLKAFSIRVTISWNPNKGWSFFGLFWQLIPMGEKFRPWQNHHRIYYCLWPNHVQMNLWLLFSTEGQWELHFMLFWPQKWFFFFMIIKHFQLSQAWLKASIVFWRLLSLPCCVTQVWKSLSTFFKHLNSH